MERYRVTVQGITSDWYQLAKSEVTLAPGASEQIPLLLTPILVSGFPAGDYSFRVRAAVTRYLDSFSEVACAISIPAVAGNYETPEPETDPLQYSLSLVWDVSARTEQILELRLAQSRTAFRIALGLLACGTIVVLAGAVLVYAGSTQAGALATTSGLIGEALGIGAIAFSNHSNSRLDKIRSDLSRIDRARIALDVIRFIKDPSTRDQSLTTLATRLSAE